MSKHDMEFAIVGKDHKMTILVFYQLVQDIRLCIWINDTVS